MSTKADYSKVLDRLTDALNLQIIEPVLRVHRAYRHSVRAPRCQEHLMCLVNRHPDQGKPGQYTISKESIEPVLHVHAYRHSVY